MGHKTHPLGFRLGITQEHKAIWFSNFKNYSKLLQEDFLIRNYIYHYYEQQSIESLGITKIVIERSKKRIVPRIFTIKPGILVGKSAIHLYALDKGLKKLFPNEKTRIALYFEEVENQWSHAIILADYLAQRLQERIPFRVAIKEVLQLIEEEEKKNTIQGIKIQISGRLNGAEIARTEWLREKRVPLQTLRADIDYSYKTAKTIYGILGIKIWVFKGEKLNP